MENRSFVNTSEPFSSLGREMEEWMERQYPGKLGSGHFDTIHVGRNRDAGVGQRGGYRINGNASTMSSALYFSAPSNQMDNTIITNEDAKTSRLSMRASDSIQAYAVEAVKDLMDKGMTKRDAQNRVNDSISKVGYFDQKTGEFVVERIKRRVNDSILSGMTTPMWDISVIQKIFHEPILRGYADGMVSKIGIPNPWADLVQIFTETFEGAGARVSNVAKSMGTFNTSVRGFNQTGTMLSEIINLVIDYESPTIQEQAIDRMPGQWLSNAAGVGRRDAEANMFLEQFMNRLWYFGHAETGFEGLMQIAVRDGTVTQYADKPALELWDEEALGTNATVGADLLVKLSHFIADKVEELFYLPVTTQVRCGPALYKVLKYSQLSKVYNQNNPLSVINTVYESGNKLVGTLVNTSHDGLWNSFEIVADPMLAPNTPFNPNPWDIMFMTFPTFQSPGLEAGLNDLIMAPVPIDNMILPSAPGYRDGVVRTSLKRIGSILAPVEKTVHVIEGIGTNNWYTP